MVKELQYSMIVLNLTVVIIKYLFVSLNNFLKSSFIVKRKIKEEWEEQQRKEREVAQQKQQEKREREVIPGSGRINVLHILSHYLMHESMHVEGGFYSNCECINVSVTSLSSKLLKLFFIVKEELATLFTWEDN